MTDKLLKASSMEVFLSYRYTWEDPQKLEVVLMNIKNALATKGLSTFCSIWLDDFFAANHMTAEQIYTFCVQRLEKSDVFLAFIQSEAESKWMKMELEEAQRLNKKIILAIKEWLDHLAFRTQAYKIVEYKTLEELYALLSCEKIHAIEK